MRIDTLIAIIASIGLIIIGSFNNFFSGLFLLSGLFGLIVFLFQALNEIPEDLTKKKEDND